MSIMAKCENPMNTGVVSHNEAETVPPHGPAKRRPNTYSSNADGEAFGDGDGAGEEEHVVEPARRRGSRR